MLIRWTAAFLSLAAFAQTASTTFSYSYLGVPLPILQDSANTPTLVSIVVPRTITAEKVTVTVLIEYPNPGDLNLFIYSPSGTRTRLLERNCGAQATLRNITFDDAAESRYSSSCPAASGGSWLPNEPLSTFDNQSATGLWVLFVENNGSDNTPGWVIGYTVHITGQAISAPATDAQIVVNAASLVAGPIAPGEIVSIYGDNLGPSPPVLASGPHLPRELGGVTVAIGDVATAPLKFVSKLRVDVQVPMSVLPGGSAEVTLTYNNNQSNTVGLFVASTAPGVHTRALSGTGQAIALNEDGSANGSDAPASIGSEIRVRVNGLGITVPAVPDGEAPPATPPRVYNPVTASVDGYPAEVSSAVLVPDNPGVYEVTLRIPTGISKGNVIVKVASSSNSSQDGAFIWVR